MTKIALWFLSTLSVVVLLFGYHTSLSGRTTAAPPAIHSSATTPATAVTPGTSAASPAPELTAPTASTGSAEPTPPSTTTTVTGDVASTEWGPVQVELTVTDGSIEQVSVVQYPAGNHRDEEINSYALPILVQETLDAQSAQIDMVSGATVTSVGYLTSLQSAIDSAGLTA